MERLYVIGKIVAVTIFGTLGSLSALMFPFLITVENKQTSNIGYLYFMTFLISACFIYLIIKKDFKHNN